MKASPSNRVRRFSRREVLGAVGRMKGVVCGAGGTYNTMPDERIELSQLFAATRIYALAALAICS